MSKKLLDHNPNLKIFLVGGAVRDELLGLPCNEHDWVVVGSNEQTMLELGFQKVGKDFPVFLHPKTAEEYALARTERKTASGYYGFKCDFAPNVTLEDDLQRRDLTINAIAKDLNGKIIDPFNGQLDLNKRILRHVSPAFVEDPLRVLRVARFAAKFAHLGFTIHPTTLELMNTIVNNNELDYLTVERVWKEIEKALITNNPQEFFLALRSCNALSKIFPALDQLWGIPQSPKWHPEIYADIHVMLSLKQAAKLTTDPKIRFAVLCHDLGKGNTDPNLLPKHYGHEERGVELITAWCNKYKVPNNYKYLALMVAKWHLHSHKALELTPKVILKLFLALDAFRNPKNLDDFLLACIADARGRQGKELDPYESADFLRNVFTVTQQVTAKPFLTQGITGKNLGEAIHKARLNAIVKFKKNFINNK